MLNWLAAVFFGAGLQAVGGGANENPVAATVSGMTSGRLWPTVAALMGLIGVVIGGLALARSAARIGTGHGRRGASVALVLGLFSIALGGLFAATAAGGFGTGNGLAGAIVAVVLGLISTALGGLARTRARRTG